MPQDPFAQFVVGPARSSAPVDPFAQFAAPAVPVQDSAPRKPAATEDYLPVASGWLDSAKHFVGNFAHTVDPRPALKLLYDVGGAYNGARSGDASKMEPLLGDLKGIVGSHAEQFKKAKQAYDQGRYSEAVGHTMAGILPLVGPAAANAGEQIGSGDVSGGMGSATGLLAGMAAPAAIAKVKGSVGVPGLVSADPAMAEAVAAGERYGVPLDAATVTGNRAVAAAQHLSDRALGGSVVAKKAATAQAQGLASMGEQLAAKGYAKPVTPELAGDGVRSAVDARATDFATKADAAYTKLRAIEEKTPIPVDLAPVKAAIKPMYDSLAAGGTIAPLQGSKATAFRAMARIIEGPDVAGASVVDSALSDLKALQRDAKGTPGAGAANQIVARVQHAVERAVTKAGPEASKALSDGRAATIAKYDAQGVLDSLHAEPVKAFEKIVGRDDTAIEHLRGIAKEAPGELPKIGRAYLDDLLSTAKSQNGFNHADKLFAEWQKIGPETKKMLYKDPGYIKDLDNFFLLAKKTAENANPSGTAHAVALLAQGSQLLNPVNLAASVAGTAGLSKFLHSAAGVRLLTKGFKMPLQMSKAATASYVAELSSFAQQRGFSAAPAMAGGSQTETGAPTARR